MSALQVFLGYLQTAADVRAPYIWQGKADMMWTPEGLRRHAHGMDVYDCSGLITCALKAAGGPDYRATHSADTMWREFAPTNKPEAGDLVFYGTMGKATHIEAVTVSGAYIGAMNGGPHVVVPNPEAARVRLRTRAREDLIGFRANPLRKSP